MSVVLTLQDQHVFVQMETHGFILTGLDNVQRWGHGVDMENQTGMPVLSFTYFISFPY